MNKGTRLTNFDGLRGIAIILVVFYHYTSYLRDQPNSLYRIFNYGYHGVELFFIISGFVIYFTLDKYRDSTRFVIARFCRLYPVYWCSICLVLVLVYLKGYPVNIKDFWLI